MVNSLTNLFDDSVKFLSDLIIRKFKINQS